MAMDAWDQIVAALERSLNPGLFSVWIRPLAAEVRDRTVRLFAPNEFSASWIRDRLSGVIAEAAAGVLGPSPKIEVEVRPTEKKDRPAADSRAQAEVLALPRAERLGLPIVHLPKAISMPRWRFTFDDFVVGPSNELACAASKGVCRDSLTAGHLFLSSGPGLGKTHLLQAIGHGLSFSGNRKAPSIACLTAEEFATRLVLAIRAREVTRFKAEFREAIDVLLLEDVHFFQGKVKMQDELLCTLKSLQARGCKVVMTSSFLPKELENVDSQLVSCFCSGFMAVISKPDFDTRRRIVLEKARKMSVRVPDEVSELLAERITTDIRQLESCLNNLVLKARLLNQEIGVDLAWQILENYALTESGPDFERIVEFVCKCFDLTENHLRSKSRKQQVVLARNTAFYLARKHTGLTLADIGRRLGRQHSTVLKGITRVEREISGRTPLGRQLENAMERLSPS
ncbi:MAG: DnaA/Hda family protein [Desulfovibrionaceae bacterium]|nr:chromosomal replication initiator protein DnaA [Desulfovibrionaceae bacterium]MDD4951563.1 DnaA/Hda family protein [Desulfovibrionaceae bacterium]